MVGKKLDIFILKQIGQAVGRGGQIEQPASLRLGYPLVVVAVAVEDYAFMILYCLSDKRMEGFLKVVGALEPVCIGFERLCDNGVEHDIRARYRISRAEHTELEFVARESEGRGPVAVGGILCESRQDMHADLHYRLLSCVIGGLVLDGVENCGQLVAEEH